MLSATKQIVCFRRFCWLLVSRTAFKLKFPQAAGSANAPEIFIFDNGLSRASHSFVALWPFKGFPLFSWPCGLSRYNIHVDLLRVSSLSICKTSWSLGALQGFQKQGGCLSSLPLFALLGAMEGQIGLRH